MPVREIVQIGDPVLRVATPEVSLEDLRSAEVQQLIDDLIETRRAAGGAGLAAPQVGEPVRIAVAEVDAATRYAYKPLIPLTVIVNPVIEPLSDERLLINEGCLSVPDMRGDVSRVLSIRVSYLDRYGSQCVVEADGLTAGTFQHEIDHLDGVIFLDRVTDTHSLSTWAQFDRFGREAFLSRVAAYTR